MEGRPRPPAIRHSPFTIYRRSTLAAPNIDTVVSLSKRRGFVYERDDIEGIDSSVILNRLVWKYSEHEATFNDPLVDCRKCKSRFRADKLVEEFGGEGAALSDVACPKCGAKDWTEPRP